MRFKHIGHKCDFFMLVESTCSTKWNQFNFQYTCWSYMR